MSIEAARVGMSTKPLRVTMTKSDSDSDCDNDSRENSYSQSHGSEDDDEFINKKYKQLVYSEVEKNIDKYYDDIFDNKYSSEIDILTTYVKGQKNLYIQAKILSQKKIKLSHFSFVYHYCSYNYYCTIYRM